MIYLYIVWNGCMIPPCKGSLTSRTVFFSLAIIFLVRSFGPFDAKQWPHDAVHQPMVSCFFLFLLAWFITSANGFTLHCKGIGWRHIKTAACFRAGLKAPHVALPWLRLAALRSHVALHALQRLYVVRHSAYRAYHQFHATAVTARLNYYLGSSIEIGEFGAAHVWFQCFDSAYLKNAQNTTLDTNSNPNPNPDPTHINLVWKKSV